MNGWHANTGIYTQIGLRYIHWDPQMYEYSQTW